MGWQRAGPQFAATIPAMNVSSRAEIAARIRGLIAGQDESIEETAKRLGVEELALRMSVDVDSPYPTIDVIAAVVRTYAVDPSWLLTGKYSEVAHRRALETPTDELPVAINALFFQKPRDSIFGRPILRLLGRDEA